VLAAQIGGRNARAGQAHAQEHTVLLEHSGRWATAPRGSVPERETNAGVKRGLTQRMAALMSYKALPTTRGARV
jgi:hypothetical protein